MPLDRRRNGCNAAHVGGDAAGQAWVLHLHRHYPVVVRVVAALPAAAAADNVGGPRNARRQYRPVHLCEAGGRDGDLLKNDKRVGNIG